MGAHPPTTTIDDADTCPRVSARPTVFAPGARGRFSAEMFTEAAEHIQRSVRQSVDAPLAIAALVADALEQASGARIRDPARLARQVLLWHHACPPEQARNLTIAALADRAGALRRSVSRRRLERGSGE